MICGIAVGILGIIFACKSSEIEKENEGLMRNVCDFVAQVDGYVSTSSILDGNARRVRCEVL